MIDETRIREQWFHNHQATYTDHGVIKELIWRRPESIAYYVRFVFDGRNMYVTGDLGEALFCFTETADVHAFNDYSMGYFSEKLRAYHEDKYYFDSEVAVKSLREWLNELKVDGAIYDHDEMRELFESARSIDKEQEWADVINDAKWLYEIEPDYWEWMYSIGRQTQPRLRSYLVALKMASEQLLAPKEGAEQ
ncbi:hypothetical protein [Paenibacillus xylanexedens]|uniref:hypothetical protein n=1 Tax=Paenibacillus xylanexedens TaxID=528191 RepID=UPI0011A649FF|nr:hypothetical protein [Paenibacillus xylanexedens]